jgi:predicted deacylase
VIPRWSRGVWLGGCASLMLGVVLSAAAAQPDSWSSCDLGDIRIETNFPEARANGCNRQSGNRVAVLITPEQAGINPSPWYAFRILSDRRRRLHATLVYSEGKHRYWPKLSRDGKTWQRLPARRVRVAADGRTARLRVDVGPKPVWIAAQELWPEERYESWLAGLSGQAGVSLSVLGLSGQQRPIHLIATDAGEKRPGTVVLVGRQHPPEVPGAFALQPFVETVLDDSELSRRFRGIFRLVVVPELNPDGVALGHWRQNAGGMDINRDWGPFTQPETRLMRDLLASIDRDPATRLAMFLDFHATREDVFYTQRDEDPVEPPFFERRWLARLQERMPGYAVNRKPGHQVGLPTAKTWVYEAYGIPSVTFELGDETPRELIATLAEQAARAMMETLLDDAPAGAAAAPLAK